MTAMASPEVLPVKQQGRTFYLSIWISDITHCYFNPTDDQITSKTVKLVAMALASVARPERCGDGSCQGAHAACLPDVLAALAEVTLEQALQALDELDYRGFIGPVADRNDCIHLLGSDELTPVQRDRSAIVAMAKHLRRQHDEAVKEKRKATTALYRWYDPDDRLLYVGISNAFADRQSAHVKRSSWGNFAARSSVEWFETRPEAEAAERRAIEAEQPLFNHQHNDTPEARRRLVGYLVERRRTDLLRPEISRG